MNPIKEANKLIDDLRAAQEDIDSGRPDLQRHGLIVIAALYVELAERAEKIPGFGRVAVFMREQAEATQHHIDGIDRCAESNKLWRAAFERQDRAEARRRESIQEANRKAGQSDLFGDE